MTDDLKNKFSEPFVQMAARIERNDPKEFAGSILIVPPEGEPIAVLMTDPTKDLEAFWSMASGKIAAATAQFMAAKQGGPGGWPGGRR